MLGCIQCGLCIDACDAMMTKIGRPTRLIAYDTEVNIKRRLEGLPPIYRFVRARTVIYVAVIAVTGLIMLYSLAARSLIGINVLHDRNPLFVTLSDGSVRNAYTVRFLNKRTDLRAIELTVSGVPSPVIHIIGEEQAGRAIVAVGPDQTREVRVLVTVPPDVKPGKSTLVKFTARDVGSGETATETEHFVAP
jgi:polyferredoxin